MNFNFLTFFIVASVFVLSSCSHLSSGSSRKGDSYNGYSKTSIAYPTGRKDNSVLWIEKSYPSVVKIGKPFTYTITVTNLTNLSVPNVVLSEQIPSGFNVESSKPEASSAYDKIQWALGELTPNEKKVITVSGVTDSKAELPCCTAATYDPPTLCVNTSVVQPDLKFSMTAADKVTACEGIPLEFTVSNPGDVLITDVKITSDLPPGVMIKGKDEMTIYVGSLSAGDSKTFTEIAYPSETGSYDFTANVVSSDELSATASANTTVVKPSLSILANVSTKKQFIGRDLSYNIIVSNNGDAPAESTIINASLEGMRAVSATHDGSVTQNTSRWNLGTIQPGDNKTVRLNASAVSAGLGSIEAIASAVCSENVKTLASAEIVGIPAILLEVIDLADPIQVGGEEVYVIKVSNQGSAPDSNIKIAVTLDENQEYISSSGETTASVKGKTITFDTLASLSAKDIAEWRVVVRGITAGDSRIHVSLNSAQLTKSVEETEATTIY